MSALSAAAAPVMPIAAAPQPAMRTAVRAAGRAAPPWEVVANLALTAACALAIALVLVLSIGPRFLAYETFIVRSGSMEPTIHTGALVIVQPVQPRDVKVGDVITFRRPEDPDNTITHRVIEIRQAAASPSGQAPVIPVFRTKGDANKTADPWDVQLQGIAWRVAFSVPFAGYLFAFTQQPAGRALFLIVPGLGLGFLWLHRTWLRLRRP